ncbi:MAG: Gx transporter family protein [Muribaculaceae bacterium]|nr:Gx transporter family protein [Roseburia sp.]MCM1430417.1 Gx transporter family protein [Muribaculaceae bacterium]MCM1492387.1 Gx transporter family protein [Muribaculaceae bacterium]
MASRSKQIAKIGMCIAVAMICSYIETLVPLSFGIPGIKLGLANLVVLLTLYTMGTREALLVSVLRIVLTGFLFGNLFSILYSLAGGLLSFLVMWLLKRCGKLGCVSVSVAGGISHNIGQLFVAVLIVENYHIFYYAPVLLTAGLLTGLVIGILSQEIITRVPFRESGKEG